MNAILRNERGSALLISLCLLGMLTLIAIAAVQTSTTDIDLSFNRLNSDKAFYIAEAGARRAMAQIESDPTWNTGYTSVNFGGGDYSVTVEDSTTDTTLADTVLITATGRHFECVASVEIMLAPGVVHPFQHAMFADDDVDIRNSMQTDSYNSDSGTYWATRLTQEGDVGSNGTISVNNGAFIGGDVATSQTGGATVNGGATVTGTISSDAPQQDLDIVPQSEFDWAAANNSAPSGLSGTYSFDPSTDAFQSTGNVVLSSGVYYFSSLILKNSSALTVAPGANVTIYVSGDIELKNSSSVNNGGKPSDLIIYSQGDLTLKNSGNIYAVFYSPDGDCDLRNSGEFYGSIVANTIIGHNSSNFHYDRQLGSITRDGSGDLDAIAWREL